MLPKEMEINLAYKLKKGNGLKDHLIANGKTRWLDMGNGQRFDEGFYYLDYSSHDNLDPDLAKRYYQANILNFQNEDYEKLGLFDLVRMQHVFEHFTFEEGHTVLEVASRLLKSDGYLLITVPDLMTYVEAYLNKSFNTQEWKPLTDWAHRRIPENSPPSYYFSIYSHSLLHEQHKWCYDYEGLEYQVKQVASFKNIRRLDLLDSLANIPFTHNRPKEDVCLLAEKI